MRLPQPSCCLLVRPLAAYPHPSCPWLANLGSQALPALRAYPHLFAFPSYGSFCPESCFLRTLTGLHCRQLVPATIPYANFVIGIQGAISQWAGNWEIQWLLLNLFRVRKESCSRRFGLVKKSSILPQVRLHHWLRGVQGFSHSPFLAGVCTPDRKPGAGISQTARAVQLWLNTTVINQRFC